MLRITVHDNLNALTFQLEGGLAGPWVRVLEECWQSALARQHRPVLRVDLTGMTSIDAAGQACLGSLHREGAEFVAADCLMKAVVDEITGDDAGDNPLPDRGPPEPGAETRDARWGTVSLPCPAAGPPVSRSAVRVTCGRPGGRVR